MRGRWLVLVWVTVWLVVGCQGSGVRPAVSSLPEACPTVPPLVVRHAKGFTISYHEGYKKVTVTMPWLGAAQPFVYILRLCDRPLPAAALADNPQVLAVPVRSWISLSSTHLAALTMLDADDHLIGVDALANIHDPQLKRRSLLEVGGSGSLNVERVLAAKPDVVSAFGVGSPQFDAHPQLLAAGVPVAIVSDYLEETPLGRAEWIKFFAAFLNREAQAEELFQGIETRYQSLRQRVRDRLKGTGSQRPTVLVNFAIRGQWFVPSGRSYVAALLADAGAEYFWAGRRERIGSIPLDWETVLRTAGTADFWLHGENHWQSLSDAIAQDERYQALRAVQLGQVYNNNRRVLDNGSNDYWERGVMEPDVILQDLVTIFHPQLLPGHRLVYYRRLGP